MLSGYKRYLEAKNKRLKAREDTPEIIGEIQLAYMEAFEEHKKWRRTKNLLPPIKIEGEPLHPEMIQDLSIYFGDEISGFSSKFRTPLNKIKK